MYASIPRLPKCGSKIFLRFECSSRKKRASSESYKKRTVNAVAKFLTTKCAKYGENLFFEFFVLLLRLAPLTILFEFKLLNIVSFDAATRPVINTLALVARKFFQFVL